MSDRLRIVVAGMAGYFPLGGVAWDYFQYVLGFAALGHDVFYYEDMSAWPYDPTRNEFTDSPNYSINYIHNFFSNYAPDMSDRWHYQHLSGKGFGVSDARMQEVLKSADLFINVSGATILPPTLHSKCVTVFLDTDPGYNQMVLTERFSWHPNVDDWAESVINHQVHATYAENINGADCLIPHAGFTWIPSRIPIFTPAWIITPFPKPPAPWTTVMTWNGFKGPLKFGDKTYGSKDLEFARIERLPSQMPYEFNIAFGGANAPVERVRAAGWAPLKNPDAIVFPDQYRQMIQ